jgi:acyl-coenzyme A thioesterase PaaI-like protein
VLADATLVRTGKNAQFAECSLTDGEGNLVARASCTFLALDDTPKKAKKHRK